MADKAINPFTPNFGRIPPILVGRELLVNDMERAFSSGASDPRLCTLLSGARGTGKTAMMGYLARIASANGWVAASASALPGMLDDIFQRAVAASQHLVSSPERLHVTSVGIPSVLEIGLNSSRKNTGNWRTEMSNLLDALATMGTGLLLCVDEVVPDLDEMKLLSAAFQHFITEGRKVALVMAGLPANVSDLLNDKSVSFLLRASQETLGLISGDEVREGLKQTVESAGGSITAEALDNAVRAIGGFPYLLQLVGFYAWEASSDGEINETDVERGSGRAWQEYADGVLRRTYIALSPMEREFVQAMAQQPGVATMTEIAAVLGKSPSYIRVYRKRLEKQGVIEALGSEEVAFALPRFGDYIAER